MVCNNAQNQCDGEKMRTAACTQHMRITDQLHHQLNLRLRHVQPIIRMVTQLNVV